MSVTNSTSDESAALIPGPSVERNSRPQGAVGLPPELARRIFDLSLALPASLVLLPLLGLLAMLVRLTSDGPSIYRNQVAGRLGRPFTLYKFRTMVPGASQSKTALMASNEADWPMFKMRQDPRVTSFGRFLRRHSLDELPQLWNVIKGDMSLVGPRPVLLSEWVHFEPWQRQKLAIRPGAICLWHLRGQPRDLATWIRLDLEYMRTWSVVLDFKILLLGSVFMLRGQNY
jgi:lipopolysaccharide/colanic/teichoic acid biosynthesis glycosyltransferase